MSQDIKLPAISDRSYDNGLPVPPTDFRKPMIVGMAVIGIAFGGFAAWASLAPLDSAVLTQGTVSVESKRKMVQHREGGIVAEVLVREGDTVAAGAVMVRLQDVGAQAQLTTLNEQLDAKTAQRARLLAERDNLLMIAFPKSLDTRRDHPATAEMLTREQDRFTQRRATLDGQRSILDSRIAQLESQRDGRSQLENSKRTQLDLLRQEIEGLRTLEQKGYYSTNKLRAAERELARTEGEMLNDGSGADQTEKEIAETRLQILQLEQKQRDEVMAELIEIDSQINELGQKIIAARDSVERLAIVAPENGIVQNLKVAGPGAVIHPGGEVAEMVPQNDRLIVETNISPQDIDRVHTGQGAELRFSAFNAKSTPTIIGSVTMVSADRNTDPATREAFYTARVEVAEAELAMLPGELKAGMPVEVLLEEGSRTPLQYFVKPLMDSFARSFKER